MKTKIVITFLLLTSHIFAQEQVKQDNKETFYIIGDNQPISSDSLYSTETQKKIVLDAFNAESQSKLGKFEVPGDNTPIQFYIKNVKKFFSVLNKNFSKTSNKLTQKNLKYIPLTSLEEIQNSKHYTAIPKTAKFKLIGIELCEGSIIDARLELENDDAYFYFEIISPVSILHYTRKSSHRDYLEFSHYVRKKNDIIYNNDQLKTLKVRLIDVLDYHPSLGNNYVPDDITYNFPSKEDANDANVNKRRVYKIINNTKLQHVLDLRAYTDALGLFSNEANGLFQIEGQADFFIHPFSFPRTAFYYLKKVSPFVRYSRLDNDEDFLTATPNNVGIYNFNESKLQLLQRSNLEMGLDVNIINFRFFKESPFWMSLRSPLTYHVTPIKTGVNVENINFKSLGYGIAADIELKRYNNFGLNLGYELKGYSYLGEYSSNMLQEPSYLKTQAVKAEIFFYPNDKKSQSIFLRMKSIRDVSTGRASFFQLQFGYKFTIGITPVKSQ
ncbi:hypothetical protein Q4Q35_08885 [Flavivirga aquimarina]|uniref:Outer membrane protein beta-barrel domain-containing protein n=1 Tax=Flavivirga aquimarina TaxID=2027862 RepID=A0ABT8WA24_9FLAO|nr:hypothetical protein [Flavivirga aquimarina]MDO5969923.1 hypothetical protein [Flavivirga aquimarina]